MKLKVSQFTPAICVHDCLSDCLVSVDSKVYWTFVNKKVSLFRHSLLKSALYESS